MQNIPTLSFPALSYDQKKQIQKIQDKFPFIPTQSADLKEIHRIVSQTLQLWQNWTGSDAQIKIWSNTLSRITRKPEGYESKAMNIFIEQLLVLSKMDFILFLHSEPFIQSLPDGQIYEFTAIRQDYFSQLSDIVLKATTLQTLLRSTAAVSKKIRVAESAAATTLQTLLRSTAAVSKKTRAAEESRATTTVQTLLRSTAAVSKKIRVAESAAATTLQTLLRSTAAVSKKTKAAEESRAATTVQTLIRSTAAVSKTSRSIEKSGATITLQTLGRVINSISERCYQERIQNPNHYTTNPASAIFSCLLTGTSSALRPSVGKTDVRLYRRLALVIKRLEKVALAKTRYQLGLDAQVVLERQQSKHLVIPPALIEENFIIEQMMPIKSDPYHNIQIYCDNTGLFDEPVRELVRFFCEKFIDLLVSVPGRDGVFYPIHNISGYYPIRFDNLSYFLVKSNGKWEIRITLLDLERLMNPEEVAKKYPKKNYNYITFNTLVRIFPFHVNIIIDEMKKCKLSFDDEITNPSDVSLDINNDLIKLNPLLYTNSISINTLKLTETMGKKYFDLIYVNHTNWLTERGVSLDCLMFEIPSERMNELSMKLSSVLSREIQQLNQGIFDETWYMIYQQRAKKLVKIHINASFNSTYRDFLNLTDKFAATKAQNFLENLKNCINSNVVQKQAKTKAEWVNLRFLI